jgi:uncharacterized membrane protein
VGVHRSTSWGALWRKCTWRLESQLVDRKQVWLVFEVVALVGFVVGLFLTFTTEIHGVLTLTLVHDAALEFFVIFSTLVGRAVVLVAAPLLGSRGSVLLAEGSG